MNLKPSMRQAVCTAAALAALGVTAGALAQGSTLRIACTGPNAGAEISVNGEFKGECPLDVRVNAGTVNLRGVKAVDATREQVFEQSFRLGSEVVKQVNVQLSAPRTKSAQPKQTDAPATTQAAATQTPAAPAPAAAPAIPARPQVPLAIPESAWAALEASEGYRNLPVPRSMRMDYQTSMLTEFTGSKSRSLPRQAPVVMQNVKEMTPISEKCTVMRVSVTAAATPTTETFLYTCGLVSLGMVTGGKPFSHLERVEELSGSLFPLRVGNRQTARFSLVSDQGSQFDSRQETVCEVTAKGQARDVDPRLTGDAWKIQCQWNTLMGGTSYPGKSDDYFLNDLGTNLSTVGQLDMSTKTNLLPVPGSKTVMDIDGEYGSRTTTTFVSYEWSAGSPYVAGAPVPSPFTGSAGPRASVERAAAPAPAPAPTTAAAREEAPSSGPGFGAGLLGGLASKIVDRNAAKVNSALSGTGPVGNVAVNLNSRLAEETKAGIAKDMMSTDEARLGGTVAGALTTGIGASKPGASTGGAGAAGGTGGASKTVTKEMGAACEAEYRGPSNDPQLDSFCKLAAFNNCLDRKTGTTTYQAQTRSVCSQLDQTLRSLKSGRAATYCPLYCGS